MQKGVEKQRGILISPNYLLISLKCQKYIGNSMTWKEKTISEFHKILLTISLQPEKYKEKGSPRERNSPESNIQNILSYQKTL